MVDGWDYAFFSSCHKTELIPFLFQLSYRSLFSTHLPMLLSDYCPVKTTLNPTHLVINVYLLQDEQFLEHIKKDLDEFISLNTPTDVNAHTLGNYKMCN